MRSDGNSLEQTFRSRRPGTGRASAPWPPVSTRSGAGTAFRRARSSRRVLLAPRALRGCHDPRRAPRRCSARRAGSGARHSRRPHRRAFAPISPDGDEERPGNPPGRHDLRDARLLGTRRRTSPWPRPEAASRGRSSSSMSSSDADHPEPAQVIHLGAEDSREAAGCGRARHRRLFDDAVVAENADAAAPHGSAHHFQPERPRAGVQLGTAATEHRLAPPSRRRNGRRLESRPPSQHRPHRARPRAPAVAARRVSVRLSTTWKATAWRSW